MSDPTTYQPAGYWDFIEGGYPGDPLEWVGGQKDPYFIATPYMVATKARLGIPLALGRTYARETLDQFAQAQIESWGWQESYRDQLPPGPREYTAEAIAGAITEYVETGGGIGEMFVEGLGMTPPPAIGLPAHLTPNPYP